MSIDRFIRLAAAAYKDGARVRCKGFDKEPRRGWRDLFRKWAIRIAYLDPNGADADELFDEWRHGWLDASYDIANGKAAWSIRGNCYVVDGSR